MATKTKIQYATRLYGRDGLEYTGDIYPTLHKAIRGAREMIKEIIQAGQGGSGVDWQVHEWDDNYGDIVAGSDI